MRDLLVRYLLGELNAREQAQLESQLRDSPELRRELAYVQACLPDGDGNFDEESCDAMECCTGDNAPRGLAERTLGRICGEPANDQTPVRSPSVVAAAYDLPVGTPHWSLADITVAGGVFLAISMLFLPALRQSRDASRRTACADNMRQLGVMLVSYSDQHGRLFPALERHQNAGMFSVYLLEDDYAQDDELARLLVCRSSKLAEDIAQRRVFIRVPTISEIESATAQERCMWKQLMGGSYAYQLGFVEGNRLFAIRNENSCRKPVLADAPCSQLANLSSANHGGCGQNVLFQDGHVRYEKPTAMSEAPLDPIYLNNDGEEAAGLGRFDTVLGRSEITPGRVTLERAR